MSASTEKKIRQAAREAGTDKKMLAAQEEARKKAQSKRRWTLGTIGVVLLIALIIFLDSGILYKTTAYTVGDRKYSASELSYHYATQYYSTVNQYGSYASLFGLDTSSGIKGLDKQTSPYGDTWKEQFLTAAESELLQVKALCDYAEANGIELTDEEIAEVDANFENLDSLAKTQGYASADKMLAANYGQGVTVEMARSAAIDAALANKVLTEKQNSLEYSSDELEAKYEENKDSWDKFSYVYYFVEAEKTTTQDADGNDTETVTTEALDAAKSKADAIVAAYNEADSALEGEEKLNAALTDSGIDGTAQSSSYVSGSSISVAADWLKDASRKAGDITAEVNSGETGYNIVVFLSRDDNHYNTVSVRHILIQAEASEDGTYTDEAKAAAKARAEEILAEFNAGDKTEDSFAALANEYSEDEGSNTNGGLYEGITKGQMVQEFNDFCFAGHKAGDTGIVYGESSSYAGYHVMYFVGEGEQYSDYLAENSLLSTDMNAWIEELTSAYETSVGTGINFVGK
jgi:parvulin-like peptidyl-prolyl isomerase